MNLLRIKTYLFVIAFALFCLRPGLPAFAESTSVCHCFVDRSFNPADRFAADDYILATSFNSLLSKFYNIPKRQIVMIKMNEGVEQNELLIGMKMSKLTGVDIRKFLRLRHENETWPEIISSLAQQEYIKKDAIWQAIRSGMPADEAGARIADEIIIQFYKAAEEEIKKLRASGLNEKELALIFILAHVSEIQAEALLEQYKKQGKSWSEIAYHLGLEPDMAGKLILAYPAKQVQE